MSPEQRRELALARERVRRLGPDLLSWSGAFRFESGSHLDFGRFPFQLSCTRPSGTGAWKAST